MTATLMIHVAAVESAARDVQRTGALLDAHARRLDSLVTPTARPTPEGATTRRSVPPPPPSWMTDAALATITGTAAARLAAIAADLGMTATLLRAAVAGYRIADERSSTRLGVRAW